MASPRLLFSCGELSGDLYGSELVRELKRRKRDLAFFGLGGDRMEAEGLEPIAHIRELAVVGLVEVLKHLPHIRRIFNRVLAEVDRDPPAAAVLIDYPDFNLRLARELHRRGIPVVYYISPQIWAWRPGRIRGIARAVSRMLVIFPFEKDVYERAGVPVSFVGHPLVDLVERGKGAASFLKQNGLDPSRPIVTVAPGSRPKEVAHNLPPLVGAVRRLHERRQDLQFVAALAPGLAPVTLEAAFAGLPVRIVQDETHEALSAATVAILASGTVTVEAALLGTPMIVVYRLSPLTYAIGRPFVRVPHYAMVNLIAGRLVVPERIQADFTAEAVTEDVLALLETPGRLEKTRLDLAEVRRLLGEPGASGRAAEAVLEVLGAETAKHP
jgi:lipid-A-disaccharide synthase